MLPGLANGTINGESSSTGNKNPKARKGIKAHKGIKARKDIKAIASSSIHGTGNTDSLPCGTLSKVPREVRNMIYTNVIVIELHENILRRHRFLGRQPCILAQDSKHLQSVDAALLRTCKAIYHEAIRILYGKNSFYFLKPSDIEDFAHLGLGSIPFGFYGAISKSASVVKNAPYGRLTMIQRLSLRLSSENSRDDLQKVWSFWSDFLYPAEKQDHLLGFPALGSLGLDLTDWKLNAGDASEIRVSRFVFHILCHLHQLPLSLGAVSPVGLWDVKRPPCRYPA